MYTIKTENFILTLTPVANSVMINVWSEGFSAESCFDTEEALIADFASQLNRRQSRIYRGWLPAEKSWAFARSAAQRSLNGSRAIPAPIVTASLPYGKTTGSCRASAKT